MPGIDSSPSVVATDALAAIPFDSLIGSPLGAAIKAQATAAKSTVDFIRAVGLNKDASGNMEAITVVFSYQKGASTVNLIVPLLTIVPIPYIRIDNMDIDFKANISASSSTSSTETDSTSFGGQVSGSIDYWVASVSFSANYSSKKDSTATANSAYSVEYTMDVSVHAVQDSMPAGLAKVLNILQESIAVADVRGSVTVTADRTSLDGTNKIATLTVTVLDGTNKPVSGVAPTFATPTDSPVKVVPVAGTDSGKTNASGQMQATATYSPPAHGTAAPPSVTVTITAGQVDGTLTLAIGS